MPAIDLNADLGEECGDDVALLAIVTSANIATGAHAGGGPVMDRTVQRAVSAGVAIGAHPSYPDRGGFGRSSQAEVRSMAALAELVREQAESVARTCAVHGVPLSHVKAHGALYNDAMARSDVAAAVAEGAREAGASTLVGLPGSELERACADLGLDFIAEAYADRAYLPDGSLVPRTQSGAVLHDPELIAARVLRLVCDGTVAAVDGSTLRIEARTVCVHGDTPGAVEIAQRIRRVLEEAGVTVRSPS